MKRAIDIHGEHIAYTVRHSSRARHLRMTIDWNRGLIVSLPVGHAEHGVEGFLREKAAWILRHMRKFQAVQNKIHIHISHDEYHLQKFQALATFSERVAFFHTLYPFPYKGIRVRLQKSLWGSCSHSRNLQFNYALMKLPLQLLDYVVVHELCHLKEPNHSPRFWALVARTVPDHKALRKALRGYVIHHG